MDSSTTDRLHDIVVVSDLHMGRGLNPRTGRYHRLEAFFYDDDFRHFCSHLVREARDQGRRFKLVLNGDTFDLLRIEPENDPRRPGGGALRFSPALTPARAAQVVRHILDGHQVLVRGLAEVLVDGHQIIFTPGNHDPEMGWEVVQDEVRRAILAQVAAQAGPQAAEAARARLVFEPWFHYEPGRIWIEHGCQYDPENSFKYPLRSGSADLPDEVHEAEVDQPLGTFFQRYLYNKFGSITFIVPNSRSNFRYFRWLVLNRPRLLARIVTVHLPFFFQVLRRLAKIVPSEQTLRQRHEAELGRLAATSPAGDKLYMVDQLKQVQASASIVARQILSRVIKGLAYMLLGAFLAAGLWFLGFDAISSMKAGFGFKTVLFLTLNFLFLLATVGGLAYLLLRPASVEADPKPRRAAIKLARLLEVPIVTFGHTHDEVIARIDGVGSGLWPLAVQDLDAAAAAGAQTAWYFNTGTWIAVFAADALLPRERVQYTFLRVRDYRGELLHWSPGRAEATPVILLEEDHHHQGDQSDRPADVHAN